MNDLIVAPQTKQWQKLKALVLDSVSSPITKRVYNLGLDEFFAWYGQEPRAGFTKATVSAWRVALEARGLGSVSINVRITAVRKLAVEAADNGLLAPELAAGISRGKGAKSKSVRVGNLLSVQQAQKLLNAPNVSKKKGLRDRAMLAILLGCGLRRSEVAALTMKHIQQRDNRWCIVDLVGKHGRVPDVCTLREDAMSRDAEKKTWRVFLYTQKAGDAVFLPIPENVKLVLDALPLPRGAAQDCPYYFWNSQTSRRAVVGIAERTLSAVFKKSGVRGAHAHRYRHTLATRLLEQGATFEEVADILGNSPAVVRKHYGKWSKGRQANIDRLMFAHFESAGATNPVTKKSHENMAPVN